MTRMTHNDTKVVLKFPATLLLPDLPFAAHEDMFVHFLAQISYIPNHASEKLAYFRGELVMHEQS